MSLKPSRPYSPEQVMTLILLGAAMILRINHLAWGLPSLLEEAMPLKRALMMIDPRTGAIDWNPHFFNYPSFAIYLHLVGAEIVYHVGRLFGGYASPADFLLAFQIDPSPMVIAGRVIHVLAELATVMAVFRIGQRVSSAAAALAGALVVFSAVLIRTQNTIIVDTLATALVCWSIERLLAWADDRQVRDLVASAALLGLATSTKYPALVCAAPLVFVIHARARDRFLRLAPAALAIAALAFVATSPYVVLDLSHALRDIAYERQHLSVGHLGGQGPGRLLRNLAPLVSLGPVGLVLLVLSPLALRDARERAVGVPVLMAFALLVAPVLGIQLDAERYLAPAIPMACLMIAIATTAFAARLPVHIAPWARVGVTVATLLPVTMLGVAAATHGTDDTQRQALVWCRQHVAGDRFVIEEGWAAPLVSRLEKDDWTRGAEYRGASAASRARFDRLPAHDVVSIPMWVTGTVELPALGSLPPRRIEAIDLDGRYYQPALYSAADYVITSDAVRGRYLGNPARFPEAAAFYALLDRTARRVAEFKPSPAVSGPVIRIYAVTSACRAALASHALPDDWWLPASRTALAASRARAPESTPPAGREVAFTASRTALDLTAAQPVYQRYFEKFTAELAYGSLVHGDTLAAERLALSAVAADSSDINGALLASICLEHRGERARARNVLIAARAANPEQAALLEPRLAHLAKD